MSVIGEPSPVRQFETLLESSSFVFVICKYICCLSLWPPPREGRGLFPTQPDYRGHWCPFCISHLKELVAMSGEIKDAGGTVVAVTAEAPEHLEKVRASTGLTDTMIADPENLLANELKSKGLLDVAVSDSQLFRLRGYKHGLAQPALLAIKNDGSVLYRWAIVPSLVSTN